MHYLKSSMFFCLGGGIIGFQLFVSIAYLEIINKKYYLGNDISLSWENFGSVGFLTGLFLGIYVSIFCNRKQEIKLILVSIFVLSIGLTTLTQVYLENKIRPSFVKNAFFGDLKEIKNAIIRHEDIDIRDINGQTSLMLSSKKGFPEIVEILIKSGANLHLSDDYGCTALIHAVQGNGFSGYLDIVKVLVAAGADINAQNNQGQTALMIASQMGNEAIVEYFIQSGVIINLRDIHGLTALNIAEKYKRYNISKLIRRLSAN